jgi:sorting nexin-1/2
MVLISTESPPQAKKTLAPSATSKLVTRGPRTPRRSAGHTAKLETVDDPLGPLGGGDDLEGSAGLSTSLEQPPSVPSKESGRPRAGASRVPALERIDSDFGDDAASRRTLSFQSTSPSTQRLTQPSVSLEQAANPKFDIIVGDPHKVGDLTSSHTVYNVQTRVSCSYDI